MEKNIEKYVFVKQNFLDNEFCENTIEKLNQFNFWKKHCWTTYNYNQEMDLVSSSKLLSGENEPDILNPKTFGMFIDMGWPRITASASMPPTPHPSTERALTIVV